MENMTTVYTKPNVPLTIKMFNVSGWIVLGFSTFYTLFGIIMIIISDSQLYVNYVCSDFGYCDGTILEIFIGILSLIKDMVLFGMFPGFVMLGIGYHLKKVWQSSHYPW